MGKEWQSTSGGIMIRTRYGFSFQLPANLTPSSSAQVIFQYDLFQNQIETWKPALYSSNTDDSANTPIFMFNTNNFCDYGVYGGGYPIPGSGSGFTYDLFNVPNAFLLARSGQVMSFLLGEDLEMIDGGAATGPSFGTFSGVTGDTPIGVVALMNLTV